MQRWTASAREAEPEAEPEAEQGDIRCFSSPDLHIRPTQESETSPLKHNALRRFCDDGILDFRADNGDFAADRSEVGVTGQRGLISGEVQWQDRSKPR